MADPLSIAGLTIAILDDIISVGIRTAELIRDARAFDEDTHRFTALIESDAKRSQILRTLLFAKAAAYGGASLFEQFDEDTQQQTIRLLEESKDILQSGLDLLGRRYGIDTLARSQLSSLQPSSLSSPVSTATTLVPEKPQLKRNKSSASMQAMLMWSLRDKKRVEGIILKFTEHSIRVEKNIKLLCLANTLGVNLAHLHHLQNDVSSKQLGFDIDATLLLTQRDAELISDSLELHGSPWDDMSATDIKTLPHSSPFSLFAQDGKSYILENHDYVMPAWLVASPDRAAPCGLDTGTMKRVEALAKLLHQPKEQVLRVPPCLGWKYFPQKQTVTFVFQIQLPPNSSPVSLLNLLANRNNQDATAPTLGEKFRLATGLAACTAQFHMVGWFHESFRSENVFFFPSLPAGHSTLKLDLASPWILGFEFSRPEKGMTRANVDFQPERDIYRHPQRQGVPEVSFTRLHDIYALGVVLLEIGLWEPAITMQKNKFSHVSLNNTELVRSQLLKHADHRLEKRVGQKYKDIVVKCLQGDFGVVDDTKEDLKLQQAFRAQVVDVLERAADSV